VSALKLQQICKSYGQGNTSHCVLQNVNLDIQQGEFVAIMGASGSGKSTLLNILGLLDTADSGDYFLQQRKISELSSDIMAKLRNNTIGFVFQ